MRTTRRVSGLSAQFDLFGMLMESGGVKRVKNAVENDRSCVYGNPAALCVGTVHFAPYLCEAGHTCAIEGIALLSRGHIGIASRDAQ